MVKINDKNAKDRISKFTGPQMVDAINTALFKGGNLIQTSAQKSITDGAVSGKFHVPSNPGEPPKADTHGLDRQIETALVAPLQVEVTSNAKYARALEDGTSKMKARPYMGPAARRERAAVVKLVQEAVGRVVNVNITMGD